MSKLPHSPDGFIDAFEASEKTLLVINRTKPKPFVDLLSKAFSEQSVTIAETNIPEESTDLVSLVDGGTVVATTPLSKLAEAFLLVNTDRYRTGVSQTDIGSFPDVLTGLDEAEFVVRGFPQSNKEKLLLVVISRFIEHRALTHDNGELHTTFQRLSRLDDEYGTRTMYEQLAESSIDTHIYGIRDDPTVVDDLGVTVHDGTTETYQRSWIVVFSPEEPGSEPGTAALVATEFEPNVWRNVWTYDGNRTKQILASLEHQF